MTALTQHSTPREVRAAWVAALRSGQYRQTTHRLKRQVKGSVHHCCLGVLCEIAAEAGLVDITSSGYLPRDGGDLAESLLPSNVRQWAGLLSDGGCLREQQWHLNTLSRLNDNGRYTFEQIADVIESDNLLTNDETDES
jgi:hypothetical protein